MMKSFLKYFFVSLIAMFIGGVLGWQAYSYKIRSRVFPFDREPGRNLLYDFIFHEPHFDFHFTPGEDTFTWWSTGGKIGQDFDSQLARVASFSTSFWMTVSFNTDVTVQQIRDIDAQIRKYGFPPPKILIEDNRDTRTEKEERLFSELRIGQSMDFYHQCVEWAIDEKQEEATKRMRNQRNGGVK